MKLIQLSIFQMFSKSDLKICQNMLTGWFNTKIPEFQPYDFLKHVKCSYTIV